MPSRLPPSTSTRVALSFLALALVGCGSSSNGASTPGTGGASAAHGGSVATGGASSAGGSIATGGAPGSGGWTNTRGSTTAPGSGGATTASGGATSAGGAKATGGTTTATGGSPSTGGRATGGSTSATGTGGQATGGATAAGGATGTGGTRATGGTTTGTGGTTIVEIVPGALYAAPNGVKGATATIDAPTTLADAVSRVNAGGTIYVRGGTYPSSSTITLSRSGGSGSPINLRAYPLDTVRPRVDFSTQATGSRGVSVSGNYWHVYGIDFFGAGDNCMFIGGSNNTIEFSTFSECEDSGLQMGSGAASNLVLNCDSYFNADATLENADGFAAKLDVGSGNKFVGCRAWNNLDDGWDGYLRGADNVTTSFVDCWAIDNGKLKSGSVGAGDGNGFKTGGSDDKTLSHNVTYQRCIAAGNVHDGFDHNSNRGSITILNCAAHANGSNINFTSVNIAASLTIKNTISLGTNGELSATKTDITGNSWQNGLSATGADFVGVDTALLKAARKSDGSLPDIDYLKLVPGSDLRNAGIDVGLPFSGSAPDVGPFESAE